MKSEKAFSALTGAILSLCLGFGATASMVTGLWLEARLWGLLLPGILISGFFSLLLCHRRGGWLLLGTLLACVAAALLRSQFREDLFSMLCTIVTYYDNGYGIGIPELFLNRNSVSHLLPLLLLQTIISATVCWTVIRRYPLAPTVFAALLPMASCFVVIDTVPEVWCILLWMFGLILLLLTHPVRQRDESHGNQLIRITAIPVALSLIVLSLCIPQQGYTVPQLPFSDLTSFWEWTEQYLPFVDVAVNGGSVWQEAMSPELDLSSIAERKLTSTPVMEVSANFSGTVYLRGRDYDVYTQTSWKSSPNRTESNFLTAMQTKPYGTVTVRTRRTHAQLFVPYYPAAPTVFTDGLWPNSQDLTEYSFDCVRPDDSTSDIPFNEGVAQRYTELPETTLQEAKQILRDVFGGYMDTIVLPSTPLAAKRIADYVEQSASYDLRTDAMPPNRSDFAIWFLEEAETGYCVHFASAATVLLRAAGIPARYVEGYVLDVNVGRVTTVTERTAHAWVEYYVAGEGWKILEATPGYTQPEPTEPSITQPTQPEPTEPPETEPTDPTQTKPSKPTDPTQSTQPEPTEPAGPSASTPAAPSKEPFRLPPWAIGTLQVLLVTAVLILLVWLQWYLRRRCILRRLHRGSSNVQAIAHYRQARKVARHLRTPIPDELTQLAERACFSHHQITDQELAQFSQFLSQCQVRMKESRLPIRLWYRLILALY